MPSEKVQVEGLDGVLGTHTLLNGVIEYSGCQYALLSRSGHEQRLAKALQAAQPAGDFLLAQILATTDPLT